MAIDYQQVEQFAGLFSGGEVPKFPQHRDDLAKLNDTQRMKVRAAMPELWQSLHGGGEADLPADVMLRMHRNELQAGDEVHLKTAGLEAAALELEAQQREAAFQASMEKMRQESEARAEAQERQRAQAEMSRMESIALQQRMAAAQNRGY